MIEAYLRANKMFDHNEPQQERAYASYLQLDEVEPSVVGP